MAKAKYLGGGVIHAVSMWPEGTIGCIKRKRESPKLRTSFRRSLAFRALIFKKCDSYSFTYGSFFCNLHIILSP